MPPRWSVSYSSARVGSRQLVRGLGQALDLVDRKSGALHTTLPALDSALRGGLPPSSITEVPLLPPSRTAHTKLTCATGGRTGRSREDAVLPPDGGPGLPARGGGRPRRVRGLHRYRSRIQPQTVHSRPCRSHYATLFCSSLLRPHSRGGLIFSLGCRLVEILTTRYPRYAEAGNVHSLLQPFTQRVTVYRVDSTTDLMSRWHARFLFLYGPAFAEQCVPCCSDWTASRKRSSRTTSS